MYALGIFVWLALAVNAGCTKPTHERIDEWRDTQKGPGKLRGVLSDPSLDPDVVAHAAANLISLGDGKSVKDAFVAMPADRKRAVGAKLAPRLWEVARIEGAMTVPNGSQVAAKDALWDLRTALPSNAREPIDGYLLDWYTGGYYEGRAVAGRYPGALVMRELGERAGVELMKSLNEIVVKPAVDKKREAIGDQLLRGLAASGCAVCVGRLLALLDADMQDPTLPDRVATALHRAYVDPEGLHPTAPASALVPHVDALVRLARNPRAAKQLRNDALQLLRITGAPTCVEALVALVKSSDSELRLVAAHSAITCGGAAAIAPVLAAIPDGSYELRLLGDTTWREMVRAQPAHDMRATLRSFLRGTSVQRWIAAEGLLLHGDPSDRAVVCAMRNDPTRLRGYWGDSVRKSDPTLGTRIRELCSLTKQ